MKAGLAALALFTWLAVSPALATEPLKWAGSYAGVQLGYGWAGNTVDYSDDPSGFFATTFQSGMIPVRQNLDARNALGGMLAGFNAQSGALVFGFEADLTFGGLKGETTYTYSGCGCSTLSTTAAQSIDWFTTLRARIGVMPASNWLVFVTAGAAAGHVHARYSVASVPAFATIDGETSGLRAGVAYGAGSELAITANVTARLEYLHLDLGSENLSAPYVVLGSASPYSLTGNYRFTADILRAALTYRW